ncbi:MAG: hypothetical protein GY867_08400 [bacterium]|nr:hypothetical protein [bacterium]
MHDRLSVPIDPGILADLREFFNVRTTKAGIGVYGKDLRGAVKVQANLRHTCQGFLLAHEAVNRGIATPAFYAISKRAASIIAEPRTWDELLGAWFSESWPVGGVASYIVARDVIFREYVGDDLAAVARVWPQVRAELLNLLTLLPTMRIRELCVDAGQDLSSWPTADYYPWWDSIKGLPELRLHSTLGCLHLVGGEIGSTNAGSERLKMIISQLADEVGGTNANTVSFAPGGRASMAAACAMLDLLLTVSSSCGLSLTSSTRDLVGTLISYIEGSWDNPEHYHDYWSEFCVPLIANSTLLSAIAAGSDSKPAAQVAGLDGLTTALLGIENPPDRLMSIAEAVSAVALAD